MDVWRGVVWGGWDLRGLGWDVRGGEGRGGRVPVSHYVVVAEELVEGVEVG